MWLWANISVCVVGPGARSSIVSRPRPTGGSMATDGWLDGVNELPFDRGAIKKLKRVIQHRQKMLQTG